MKTTMIILLLLALTGCQSSTQYGPCIGLGEDRNPALEYKLSARNLVVALIFIELIAPPIIVGVDETFCPIGMKSK